MAELLCEKHGDDTNKPKSLCWNCYLDLVKDQKQKLESARSEVSTLKTRVSELEFACRLALDWLNRFGENAPIIFGGEPEVARVLSKALGVNVDEWE